MENETENPTREAVKKFVEKELLLMRSSSSLIKECLRQWPQYKEKPAELRGIVSEVLENLKATSLSVDETRQQMLRVAERIQERVVANALETGSASDVTSFMKLNEHMMLLNGSTLGATVGASNGDTLEQLKSLATTPEG